MITCHGKPVTAMRLKYVYTEALVKFDLRSLGIGYRVPTKGKQRPRRFKGICQLAKKMGVSRQHVYLVLTGSRKSPRIEREALKQRRAS